MQSIFFENFLIFNFYPKAKKKIQDFFKTLKNCKNPLKIQKF